MNVASEFLAQTLVDIAITVFVVEAVLRRQDDRRTREARRAAVTIVSDATLELLVLSCVVFGLEPKVGGFQIGARRHTLGRIGERLAGLPSGFGLPKERELPFTRQAMVPTLDELTGATGVLGSVDAFQNDLGRVAQDLSFAISGSMGLLKPDLFRAVIELRLATNELCLARTVNNATTKVAQRLDVERTRAALQFAGRLAQTVRALESNGVVPQGALAS